MFGDYIGGCPNFWGIYHIEVRRHAPLRTWESMSLRLCTKTLQAVIGQLRIKHGFHDEWIAMLIQMQSTCASGSKPYTATKLAIAPNWHVASKVWQHVAVGFVVVASEERHQTTPNESINPQPPLPPG